MMTKNGKIEVLMTELTNRQANRQASNLTEWNPDRETD